MKGHPPKIFRSRVVCGALLVLVSMEGAHATPLAVYRQRVRDASAALAAFAEDVHENQGAAERGASEARAFAEVRRLLPVTDRVEWEDGGAITVDNAWLHTALEGYEQLPASSSRAERAKTLARITERLDGLHNRLTETSGANGYAGGDKDAEKGRLAAILRRPEYNRQTPQTSALRNLFEQIRKWLRDVFPNVEPVSPGANRGLSTVAQIFVGALALIVIAWLLWKFRARLFRLHTLRVVPRNESRVVLGERLAPDQTVSDLLAEAERLARGGDLRGAIRRAYIALLCELGDRKIIRLAQHKTNRDYLDAVRRNTSIAPLLYGAIEPLIVNYERHWYGNESASEQDWSDFRDRCHHISLESKVRSPKS